MTMPINHPKIISFHTNQVNSSTFQKTHLNLTCIQEARLIGEEDLSSCLPVASGYDCALTRPANSGEALRMLVRIEGPLPGDDDPGGCCGCLL